MTSDDPRGGEDESSRNAAEAAQTRFWDDVIINEAESHVAALHRDRLLATRRAAMERLGEARQALAYAQEVGDDEMVGFAVEDLNRASGNYRWVRDNVAEELQRIIRARIIRMTAMAEHLGDAAEASSHWLSTLDFKNDGGERSP